MPLGDYVLGLHVSSTATAVGEQRGMITLVEYDDQLYDVVQNGATQPFLVSSIEPASVENTTFNGIVQPGPSNDVALNGYTQTHLVSSIEPPAGWKNATFDDRAFAWPPVSVNDSCFTNTPTKVSLDYFNSAGGCPKWYGGHRNAII